MNAWLVLLISYGFVFAVIGAATLLEKRGILKDEGSRKFIHIGVTHWWLIAMFLIEPKDFLIASIAPATFIALNYASYRYNIFRSMERDAKTENDLGTVYYAVSLFLITVMAFYFAHVNDDKVYLYAGGLAVFTMGYGDALSAVFGLRFGKRKLYGQKTLVGFVTMAVVTVAVSLGFLFFALEWHVMGIVSLSLLIGATAAVVEILTPKGLDNLSVPLFIFLLLMFVI